MNDLKVSEKIPINDKEKLKQTVVETEEHTKTIKPKIKKLGKNIKNNPGENTIDFIKYDDKQKGDEIDLDFPFPISKRK